MVWYPGLAELNSLYRCGGSLGVSPSSQTFITDVYKYKCIALMLYPKEAEQ
jgi:hypothetical protein